MEKSNKIFLAIIIFCTVCVIGICAYAIINHEEVELTDAEKFKSEYETLNGIASEVNNVDYLTVNISDKNPIVYKTGKEILDVLDKNNAFVFFGYPNDPYCRSAIETLLSSAKNNNVKTIYYVDILNIRDSYEFNGSIIPKQTKKGTDAYYQIVKFFGKKLDRYYVKDEEGNMYDTGVKRLYASTVIAVSGGKIIDMHVNTVETHTDPYVALNDEQKEELTQIYDSLFSSIDTEVCTSSSC